MKCLTKAILQVFKLTVVFFLTISNLCAEELSYKTIEYPDYTFIVPSTWECFGGDTSFVHERTSTPYNIETTSWNSPIRNKNDLPTTIYVNMRKYKRIDQQDIGVEEMRDLIIKQQLKKITVEENSISPTKMNLIIRCESKEMISGVKFVSYRLYNIHKVDNDIFYMEILLREVEYKKADIQKEISKIMNSFTLKRTL